MTSWDRFALLTLLTHRLNVWYRASRRAHRAHLTQVFGKITPILESDEPPNELDTATLQTSLEQAEAKRATLDAKILATVADADTLETEILDSEEIMFTIAEKITHQSSTGETKTT